MEFEKLKKVIAEVLSVDPDEITMETTFTDDLGADSWGWRRNSILRVHLRKLKILPLLKKLWSLLRVR